TDAGRQQHDFLVLRRQTELPERSGCFHRHSNRSSIVQEYGNAAVFDALRRDLDIARTRGRRTNRITASFFLSIEEKRERKELARTGIEFPLAINEAQSCRVRSLFGDLHQLKDEGAIWRVGCN